MSNFNHKTNSYYSLYSPPIYKGKRNQWTDDYEKVVNYESKLSIDLTAITSFLSVGQFSKNRTLFNEIKRLPWLAEPLSGGDFTELKTPTHEFKTASDKQLANILFEKLCCEAREVIKQSSNIYILLTGGLDSRIVAGVYSYLYANGELKEKPKCLTWGLEDSRDVYYAKLMAEKLDFEWQHIPLGPETVIENINKCGKYLGLLHSPEMLHSALWFKNLPADATVIAGSYGDSIGRGEFSNLHLLQLEHKAPKNNYDLLVPHVFNIAAKELNEDLNFIHDRGGKNTLKYMQCEYWMQGYRMRNGLSHALSVINRYANVYQMFTAQDVYGFIWSLHPSRRDDLIYIKLLKTYFPELAKVPWARNNKSIQGKQKHKILTPHYHDYTGWSSGVLYDEISTLVDPEWFAATGLFNKESITKMNDLVLKSQERVGRLNDIWLWLAGFRYYVDELKSEGKTIDFNSIDTRREEEMSKKKTSIKNQAVLLASNSKLINSAAKKVRKKYRYVDLNFKKKKMLKQYPPEPNEI
ncbi:asparagine synthase-related protein [Flavobacteriaceae bacterium]|nr:asparagine synthase-related protein [Flavobacteriaceae bacterium]